jgi:hypothetical protein
MPYHYRPSLGTVPIMTLRERLAAAAEERRREAGLPRRSALDLTTDDPVVDLGTRSGDRTAAAHPRMTHALAVGVDRHCPECGTEASLDLEDLAGGVDHYTCPACSLLFQVAR